MIATKQPDQFNPFDELPKYGDGGLFSGDGEPKSEEEENDYESVFDFSPISVPSSSPRMRMLTPTLCMPDESILAANENDMEQTTSKADTTSMLSKTILQSSQSGSQGAAIYPFVFTTPTKQPIRTAGAAAAAAATSSASPSSSQTKKRMYHRKKTSPLLAKQKSPPLKRVRSPRKGSPTRQPATESESDLDAWQRQFTDFITLPSRHLNADTGEFLTQGSMQRWALHKVKREQRLLDINSSPDPTLWDGKTPIVMIRISATQAIRFDDAKVNVNMGRWLELGRASNCSRTEHGQAINPQPAPPIPMARPTSGKGTRKRKAEQKAYQKAMELRYQSMQATFRFSLLEMHGIDMKLPSKDTVITRVPPRKRRKYSASNTTTSTTSVTTRSNSSAANEEHHHNVANSQSLVDAAPEAVASSPAGSSEATISAPPPPPPPPPPPSPPGAVNPQRRNQAERVERVLRPCRSGGVAQ